MGDDRELDEFGVKEQAQPCSEPQRLFVATVAVYTRRGRVD
ncbi:MAG: hypothetical protein R3F55_00275 [Alphaproteobacteria bacterium]